MFDITKLALIIPNFLTNQECDSLIQEFNQRNEESKAEESLSYKTNLVEKSSFKVVSLNPTTPNFNLIKEKTKKSIEAYVDYLDQPKYFFMDALKTNLRYSHSYRIMKYKVGAYIHPHSDHRPYTYGSITFNLNDDYEGGEFKFFNGKYIVKLKKGDALIFPSDYFWVHEVSPVTKGNRYSVNSFIGAYPDSVIRQSLITTHGLYSYHREVTPTEKLLGPYN